MTVPCYITIDASRRYRQLDQQDQAHKQAFDVLRAEMLRALLGSLETKIPTPLWDNAQAPALNVVEDLFCGVDSEALVAEAISVLAIAARGEMSPELHLRASAFISMLADKYATVFADDFVRENGEAFAEGGTTWSR